MYGLIWKDFLVLRKTLRLYVLFLLGYLGMALLGIFDLTFVTTFCVVILMILPISAFSYDEFARWDRYARTLPLSSRQIVGGRYLFVLLLLLVVAAIGAVSAVLLSLTGSADLWESLGAQLASLGAALFIVDVMLPLNYRLRRPAPSCSPSPFSPLFCCSCWPRPTFWTCPSWTASGRARSLQDSSWSS